MKKRARNDLLAIFKAGLAAADPAEAVRRHVTLRGRKLRLGDRSYDLAKVRRIFVVGAGKASARMAGALEEILGDRIAGGWINIKRGGAERRPLRRIHVHEAGHPIPDKAGLRGAREIVKILETAAEGDLVLLCLSGGGSALMPLPVEGVSLADKQAVTQALLACGADIREVNTVRKHLSQLKGGQFARAAQPAEVVALILSDVVGDPLDVIASGPSAPDNSTFADALAVLSKYGLESRAPRSVVEYLRAGTAGKKPETPKPGDRKMFAKVRNLLIASNAASVAACARKARALGYRPLVLSSTIEGEAREVARVLAAIARESLERGAPVKPPACLISGGETTVTLLRPPKQRSFEERALLRLPKRQSCEEQALRGKGLGGRNQEFALAAAIAARGLKGVTILAGGTDGTDGPTDAAGAFADGATCDRAARLGLSAADFLARNDSCHFFQSLGDLLITGPTGTNVMDLYLLLVAPKRPS
jgi:hydroxypyruvate reductase